MKCLSFKSIAILILVMISNKIFANEACSISPDVQEKLIELNNELYLARDTVFCDVNKLRPAVTCNDIKTEALNQISKCGQYIIQLDIFPETKFKAEDYRFFRQLSLSISTNSQEDFYSKLRSLSMINKESWTGKLRLQNTSSKSILFPSDAVNLVPSGVISRWSGVILKGNINMPHNIRYFPESGGDYPTYSYIVVDGDRTDYKDIYPFPNLIFKNQSKLNLSDATVNNNSFYISNVTLDSMNGTSEEHLNISNEIPHYDSGYIKLLKFSLKNIKNSSFNLTNITGNIPSFAFSDIENTKLILKVDENTSDRIINTNAFSNLKSITGSVSLKGHFMPRAINNSDIQNIYLKLTGDYTNRENNNSILQNIQTDYLRIWLNDSNPENINLFSNVKAKVLEVTYGQNAKHINFSDIETDDVYLEGASSSEISSLTESHPTLSRLGLSLDSELTLESVTGFNNLHLLKILGRTTRSYPDLVKPIEYLVEKMNTIISFQDIHSLEAIDSSFIEAICKSKAKDNLFYSKIEHRVTYPETKICK